MASQESQHRESEEPDDGTPRMEPYLSVTAAGTASVRVSAGYQPVAADSEVDPNPNYSATLPVWQVAEAIEVAVRWYRLEYERLIEEQQASEPAEPAGSEGAASGRAGPGGGT